MEHIIKLQDQSLLPQLLGVQDVNLIHIEKYLGVNILLRKEGLKIIGQAESVKKAAKVVTSLIELVAQSGAINKQDITYIMKGIQSGSMEHIKAETKIDVSLKNKYIGPKTPGQHEYVKAIKEYDIVFSIGPAGTGKTYLAVAMAVAALKKGLVRRIVLTRPAIEAGENLGFLPGNIREKFSPYLRPLYDALYDMLEVERIEKYLEMGIIEMAPLAYMRGRTLNDAFIILDEAQNCTGEQMKMFLTRLGFDSKTVITGDITQSDLPNGRPVGLLQARNLLSDIKGIKFVQFSNEDVVRHELVLDIIKAYANTNNENK